MSQGPARRRIGFLMSAGLVAATLGPAMGGCEAGPPPSLEVRRSRFPIVYQDYAKFGYRLDWIGYPILSTSDKTVEFIAPYDDAVLALEAGGIVTCLSAADGSTRWSDQLTGGLTRFFGLGRDGSRAMISAEGELFVLDMATGSLVGRQEYARLISTPPVPYGGSTFIYGSGAGEVFAHVTVSAVDKAKAWGHLAPGAIQQKIVLIGNTIGAVTQRGDVLFLDAASGSLVGRNNVYRGLATDPVTNGTVLFVASLDQSVYAFNPNGGRMLWQYRTPVPLKQQPAVYDRTLYVGVDGTGFVALDTATGKPRWTTPGVAGTVVAVNEGRLIVWDGKTLTLLDPARGDVIERAVLPNLRLLRPDKFEGGNLYAVSQSGVVARFVPR